MFTLRSATKCSTNCKCLSVAVLASIVMALTAWQAAEAATPDADQPQIVEPEAISDFVNGKSRDFNEIVFAQRKLAADGHWYANLGYYSDSELEETSSGLFYHNGRRVAYRLGARLCKLNIDSGETTVLLDDPEGGVRDPVVHYDGHTILFSYRPGNSANYNLYSINADGTGLKQLTDGPFDDIEPCWLPDGSIMFVSTRAKRWVQCWVTQVAVLYRCEADGTNIRQISGNLEHDNTPWPLPDGRVLYQRWEYVDRSQVHYHHLWTANPDGTNESVYYGNMAPGIVMIDAKPIPDSNRVLAIFSPGHGQKEHNGWVTLLDPTGGPDNSAMADRIHPDSNFRDPYPISADCFMAAQGKTIQLMDTDGNTDLLFALSEADKQAGFECHEPRPIRPHDPATVIPDRVDPSQATGRLVLADVYKGRNMEGVEPGDVKKLLVIEPLPKPINFTGGMDPLTYAGSFTLERVVGTVPVEKDGSAYLELPALRAFFFVALDENDMAIKRMQSFLSVMPGETTGCVGCHEQRTQTTVPKNELLIATQREPSQVQPYADCPDVFDYPRDIQPILDRLCVDCHDYKKTDRGGPYAGKLILSGDHGPMFSHSYFAMTIHGLFSDGRNQPKSNYAPRTLGSSASKILKMLDGSHYDVKATPHEKEMLRLWIEVGAPYPGTYAALGCGSIGGYAENKPVHTDFDWPETKAASGVIDQRCASCHKGDMILPKALSDEHGLSFWQPSMSDPRLKTARHMVYNLTDPSESLILLAPLSKEAGGLGLCATVQNGSSVNPFSTTGDPDYQKLLAMCQAGKNYLENIKRFDMPEFVPRKPYLQEMQRYGILPEDCDLTQPLDPYQLDQQYWRSLWHERTDRY